MSFKDKIHNLILSNKSVSTWEIEQLCKQENHKMSYAERELRKLMQTDKTIKSNRNKRGAIVGYYYDKGDDYCKYCNYFITHRADCPIVKAKEPNRLF